MITYELAKKLKDAGFPQGPRAPLPVDFSRGMDAPFLPTLSELIEACGDGFGSLYKTMLDGWFAYNRNDNIKEGAPTPEEAVANLWLAIKEHVSKE